MWPITARSSDVDLFDMGLRQLMNLPVEGSTRTQETVSTAPAAVTVFDAAFIKSLPVDHLYELLNYVPGMQSQRGADSGFSFGYSVRGRRNGNQSKEVLLLIDGQVLNDPRTGAANGSARMMSVAQISRVEVIRGPGSALYGSGAYSGVINVITRQQENQWDLHVGNMGLYGMTGLSHFSAGQWQLDGYLNVYKDSGDQYNLDDTFSLDAADRVITRDPRSMLEGHISISNGSNNISLIYNDIKGDDFYSLENLSNGINSTRYIHQGIQVSHDINWAPKLSSHIEWQYTSVEQHLDSQITAVGALADPALSNPVSNDPLIIYALVKGEAYRFNWHNDWQSSERLSVQFGMNWQQNETLTSEAANNFNTDQLSNNDFPVDYYGDFSNITTAESQSPQEIWGLYGQTIYQPNDIHRFNFGIRYDSNESVDAHWSPRLGWVVSLDENSTIKMLYGQAFRAASLSETSNPNSPILRGNTELKHELIETVDIIYLYQQSNLNVQAGMFYNYYDTPITVIINDENIREYTNGSSSQSYGLEFEMNYELANDVWLRVSASEFLETPQSFFREGARTGSVMLNGFMDALNWNISAVYKSDSEMEIANNAFDKVSSYWLLGGKLQYQHNKQLSSQLQIKNINNQQYNTAPQGNGIFEGTPNRGREIAYSISYQW